MRWRLLWGLILAIAIALLAGGLHADGGPAALAAGNTAKAIRIDADPGGNSATSLGGTQICRQVSSGDTFDVDVVVEEATNLLGFDTALFYDKKILKVVNRDVNFLLTSAPGSQVRDQSDSTPDADSYYGLRGLDTSQAPETAETGSGVLGRVTLQAVGSGLSTLSVNIPDISPALIDVETDYFQPAGKFGTWLGDVFDARIAVDQPCPSDATPVAPPPGVTPAVRPGAQPPTTQTPAPGATPGATPGVIEGNTADAIRIDADPSGNSATSLGDTQACRQVDVGDSFQVDLVIENVTNLQAYSATLSYDEEKLTVTGEDVEFLLASSAASDLADISDKVPDSDGVYEARALDQSADPDAAESGSGVLARLTLEASAAGLTTISVNVPSISPILTDVNGDALQPADAFGAWLGEVSDAQIAVGEACPPVTPTPTETPTATVTPPAEEEDGGTDWTVAWILGGIIGGIVLLTGAYIAWRRLQGRVL